MLLDVNGNDKVSIDLETPSSNCRSSERDHFWLVQQQDMEQGHLELDGLTLDSDVYTFDFVSNVEANIDELYQIKVLDKKTATLRFQSTI